MPEAEFQVVIAQLRERLTEAERRAEQLRATIAVLEREEREAASQMSLKLPMVPPKPPPTAPSPDSLRRMRDAQTLATGAEVALRDVGKHLHIRQLIERMRALGYNYEYDDEQMRASLVPTLHRMIENGEVFTKEAPATYGLRDWHRNGGSE